MLKIAPNGHPDDPNILGIDEWAMRQTPIALFAILRYLYDWDNAYNGSFRAPELFGRLIDDPDTDFGIIMYIFWETGPGSKHVHNRDPEQDIHRHIIRNSRAGFWPKNTIPLPPSFIFHAKSQYLEALENDLELQWSVPHRFFEVSPMAIPYFEFEILPEEREAFNWFVQFRSSRDVDHEQRLRFDLEKEEQVGEELGLVSANFDLTDHLEFVRDAVRQTGPSNVSAQLRANKKRKHRDFHEIAWSAVTKTNLNSKFVKFQFIFHYLKLKWKRREQKELPQSPIKVINRLSYFQQLLLGIVLLVTWVWLVYHTVWWVQRLTG